MKILHYSVIFTLVTAQLLQADEVATLKTATQAEIASCGTKVALAEVLGDRCWRLLPIIGIGTTYFSSKAVYQALAAYPHYVSFGAALATGFAAYPVTALGVLPYEYLRYAYPKTFDKESCELIWKDAVNKRTHYAMTADFCIISACIASIVMLAVKATSLSC